MAEDVLYDLTAIILAGGLSTRMGRDKAMLELDGKLLIEIMLRKVVDFDEIIIVTNNLEEYTRFNVKLVKDKKANCGPLGGIHAGLIEAKNKNSFVLACDMPFVTKKLLQHMASVKESYDVLVPKINGYYQPLCSIYNTKCIKQIEKNITEQEYRVKALYRDLAIRTIDFSDILSFDEASIIFKNINCQEDYIDALLAMQKKSIKIA